MKKKNLIIGVSILLLSIELSGCTSTNDNSNDAGFTGHQEMFIGTWEAVIEIDEDYQGLQVTKETWVIRDDGNIETSSSYSDGDSDTYYSTYWFLEDEDNIIVIKGTKPDYIEYRFFDGGNTLKLWEGGNLKRVLQRL